MFIHVADIGLLMPRAPNYKNKQRSVKYSYRNMIRKFNNLPDISSSSLIRSLSINGGSLFEKKSFKAVATAFTGMSNECMSTFPSIAIKCKQTMD